MITYDPKTKRYYLPNGKEVTDAQILAEIDKSLEITRRDMRDDAERLAKGLITIAAFQLLMRDKIKISHLLAASVGKGGRIRMTFADYGRSGAKIKRQYGYLNKFAVLIEKGRLSAAQIINRAGAYASGIRAAYYQTFSSEQSKDAEFCRRIINSKEGCSECADWASKGFIPVDEQPEIGSLICLNFCLCEIEYRTAN